jgi:TonB family protein
VASNAAPPAVTPPKPPEPDAKPREGVAVAIAPPTLKRVDPVAAPPPAPNPRRRTIFGRTDREVGLMMYAEGWRQKIELGGGMESLRKAKSGAYENPVVTVALRRDGSVESIVFNKSSGQPDIDEAVRRIVTALAPYAPFPPDVAQDYDIVEIRRVWTFDTALRLFAGGR